MNFSIHVRIFQFFSSYNVLTIIVIGVFDVTYITLH